MMAQDTIESRPRMSRTILPTVVVLATRPKKPMGDESDVPPSCACTNRARSGLPSVRKPPSGHKLLVRRWDSAARGLGAPRLTAKLYHGAKRLSNLCYD